MPGLCSGLQRNTADSQWTYCDQDLCRCSFIIYALCSLNGNSGLSGAYRNDTGTGNFYDLAVGRLAGDLPVRLLALDDRGFAAALSQGKCCGFCCEYGFCAGNLETGSFVPV